MTRAEDELAIRTLAAAYTDAVNRRDGAAMAAVYAPDGVLEPPGGGRPIEGRERIEKAFRRLVEVDREFLCQMTHSGLVEIEGDRARSRWWFSELKKPTGKDFEMSFGVYQDELVRLEAGWRFSRRRADGLARWELPQGAVAPAAALPSFLAIAALPQA